MSSLEDFEGFYAVVVYGKLTNLVDIKDSIRHFSDVRLVYDKTSPVKLYVTDKKPGDKSNATN